MSRRRIDYIRPSLKKSGKRWFVEYTWRNPKTGIADRVRISKGFSSCKNQTERELLSKKISEEVEAKVREGLDPRVDDNRIYNDELEYNSVATIFSNAKSRNRTLRPLLSDYLIELKPTVSQKTYESYKSKCRILGAWLEREYNDENDVVAITDQVLDRFFRFLIDERKLSRESIKKYGQQLKAIWRWFKKKKILVTCPEFDVPIVRRTADMGARPIINSDLELLKLNIVDRDPQLYLAISFEFYCFIRPGVELRNMKIGWLDLYNGTCRIPASFSKNRKDQVVVIPQVFLSLITDVYKLQNYNREMFVFSQGQVPGQTQLGKNTLRVRFNRIRDKLGLSKDYKLYSFKHTGAVMASNSGIPIKDIQMQMRHHSLDVTDKYLRKMKGVDSIALRKNFPKL